MTTLGFVILSHRCPEQTRRLIDRLVTMFDAPDIACHHDFSQSDLDLRGLPDTFRLVQPYVKTAWGRYSLIEATLLALRLLYQSDQPPQWFTLLSGVDYPIKPAEKILADLETMNADALIRHRLVDGRALKNTFEHTCLRRYCRRAWQLNLGRSPARMQKSFQLNWRLSGPWLPFSKNFRCFAGAQFFTANTRSAEHLLTATPQHQQLARHYATVPFPEESFFQTLLCNATHLRIKNDHFRHIDWRNGGAHPKVLTCEDLPELAASPAHFARKFDIQHDSAVLDCLDGWILRPTAQSACSHAT